MKYKPGFIHKKYIPQYLSVCCLHLEFLPPRNVCLLAVTGKLVIALSEENCFDFQTHLISQSADCAAHLLARAELGVQSWTQHPSPSVPT